jgi:galactokinase
MDIKREVELFVPGRLCLFGEHSDWAGRYAAVIKGEYDKQAQLLK